MDICAAYWALFQAIRMERFAEENVLRLESYRDDTHRLVEAGLATRNDELKIEVQLGNARLLRIDAQNETRVTRMALNMTLGLPLETPTDPSSDPDSYIFPGPGGGRLKEVDSLVALAGAARPDLRATHLRLQAAEASVAAARGAWWPQVVLSGGYAYQRPNARYQPPRDEFKSSWDIGIGVQLDVWNWGATGHQTEQAEAALRQAELVLGQMQENVNFEVRRAVLSLGRAGDKSEVARLSLRQAEENLRMTNDRYRSGLATSTDLLDASVALMQAQTSLSGAQVELALADARLGRALGQAGRGGRQTEGKTGK
jgi:outer membrane protein TolC